MEKSNESNGFRVIGEQAGPARGTRTSERSAELAAALSKIAELQAALEVAKSQRGGGKVSARFNGEGKGGISLFGLNARPVTLYASQWVSVLTHANEILTCIEQNIASVAVKEEPDRKVLASAVTELRASGMGMGE